jgi:integrase
MAAVFWVGAVFTAAVADRMIHANPIRDVKLPEVIASEVQVPTAEQVATILDTIRSDGYALACLIATSGLRWSEAAGITNSRVDWLRHEIRVDRQLLRLADGAPVFGPPKTKGSVRTVPVPKSTVEVLAVHVAEYRLGPDELVILNRRRRPWNRHSWSEIWRPAARAAGLAPGTGAHVLRHYAASVMLHRGVSVRGVQQVLGHATAATTLGVYAHVMENHDSQVRAALELDEAASRVTPVSGASDASAEGL